jgi:tyrosine-protein kinase Etk/Wzc
MIAINGALMQQTDPANPNPRPTDPDTIDLFDYLEVVVRHKRMIIITTVAACLLSVGVSLMLPKMYRSTVMILPPQQDQGLLGAMMGQMGGGISGLAGDLLGKGTPGDMYVSILHSDAISDAIIDGFKLMGVYGEVYRLDTYGALNKHVIIAAGKKDGIISISVEDKEPKRAADIANAYVEELAKLTVKLSTTGAGQNSTFYAQRLDSAKADLAKAEEALRRFQSRNKTLDVMEQAKATIGGIAQLRAQLASQEVQLETFRRQFTDASQEVKTTKSIIANLKTQIAGLEGNSGGGAIPSVGSVPALGQEYVRLMREYKIQEATVELLTKQYEVAKLSQAKDVSSIQVIQKARVPDKKVKPKRAAIVIIVTFSAALLAILFSFVSEFFARMPRADRERLAHLFALARGAKVTKQG